MNKLKFAVGLLLIAGLLVLNSKESLSQGRMRGGGWGMNNQYVRIFNPNSMVTFKGTISSIDTFTPRRGMSYGIHLNVKSADNQTISVHLGPAWYINNQDTKFKAGDDIEITGSKVMFNKQSVIIASEVKRGDKVLMLRDPNGIPLWAGWRSRQQ